MMDRAIVHLNVADFAVAVERVLDGRLRDRPLIVAPGGIARAAVYDMSEEAYRAGVRKGMAVGRAMRCCRDAHVLPPRPERYEQAMRSLIGKATPYSPLVEPGRRDGHLFVDVTGTTRLFGPAVDVAWRMYRQIKSDLGLDPIWSIAPNKLLAKVATRVVKPLGEYVVAAGEEAAFLAPLPLFLLPGIEHDDLLRLRDFHLTRVSHVLALNFEELRVAFGRRAVHLYETVRGVDPSPVLAHGADPPCVAAAHTFADDTNEVAAVEGVLYRLVEKVGAELRRRRRVALRIGVVVDYSDGIRCARAAALRPGSAGDPALFSAARSAMQRAWVRRVRIRHLRLACDRPVFPPAQLELFPAGNGTDERRHRLLDALDGIRGRFGAEAVRVGRTLAV